MRCPLLSRVLKISGSAIISTCYSLMAQIFVWRSLIWKYALHFIFWNISILAYSKVGSLVECAVSWHSDTTVFTFNTYIIYSYFVCTLVLCICNELQWNICLSLWMCGLNNWMSGERAVWIGQRKEQLWTPPQCLWCVCVRVDLA